MMPDLLQFSDSLESCTRQSVSMGMRETELSTSPTSTERNLRHCFLPGPQAMAWPLLENMWSATESVTSTKRCQIFRQGNDCATEHGINHT